VVERVEVVMQPKGAEWPSVLGQLVKQLDSGRLYDRDLQALAVAVSEVLDRSDTTVVASARSPVRLALDGDAPYPARRFPRAVGGPTSAAQRPQWACVSRL
jgi:hypothetical protein